MRSGGIELGGDAPDLFQFFHEIEFGVQPPGGIDDKDVGAAAFRRLIRVINDRAGVGAGQVGDNIHTDPLTLFFKLVDGCRPESVRRRQEDGLAFLFEFISKLGDGSGLAAAVDADDQVNARRSAVGNRFDCRRIKYFYHLFLKDGTYPGAVQLFSIGALLDRIDELGRGSDADIRRDKHLFEFGPGFFPDFLAVEDSHGFAEPRISGTFEDFLE